MQFKIQPTSRVYKILGVHNTVHSPNPKKCDKYVVISKKITIEDLKEISKRRQK